MQALTLMELRHEEKIFGNKLSLRHVLYLGSGAVGAGLLLGVAYLLSRLLAGIGFVFWVIWGIGGLLALIPLIAALIWAFVPALGVWRLPGPTLPMDDDSVNPPLRLDQWWRLRRAHTARTPYLPYRRLRGLAGDGFLYLDSPGTAYSERKETD